MAEGEKRKRKHGEWSTATDKPRASTTGKGVASKVKADQSNWRTRLQQARIKFDDDQKEIFLDHYAENGRKCDAATAAGVSLRTVNNHIENDPDFEEGFDAARAAFTDKVVNHHHKLVFEGEIHKKFNKDGELIEERHVYPIRLVELELKRREPAYRDKQEIDLNHGGGVMIAPADMTPEDWVREQEKLNETRERPGSPKDEEED